MNSNKLNMNGVKVEVRLIAQTRVEEEYAKEFPGVSDVNLLSAYAAKTCIGRFVDPRKTPEKIDKYVAKVVNRNGHEGVCEHWHATFEIIGVSRALSHQLVRHRIASYDQRSLRHTKAFDTEDPMDSVVVPDFIANHEDKDKLVEFKIMIGAAKHNYEMLIAMGTPKEDARSVVPICHKTTLVATWNARTIKLLLNQRLWNTAAQGEIREMMGKVYELVKWKSSIFERHE